MKIRDPKASFQCVVSVPFSPSWFNSFKKDCGFLMNQFITNCIRQSNTHKPLWNKFFCTLNSLWGFWGTVALRFLEELLLVCKDRIWCFWGLNKTLQLHQWFPDSALDSIFAQKPFLNCSTVCLLIHLGMREERILFSNPVSPGFFILKSSFSSYLSALGFHWRQRKKPVGTLNGLPVRLLIWILQLIRDIFYFPCRHRQQHC